MFEEKTRTGKNKPYPQFLTFSVMCPEKCNKFLRILEIEEFLDR